MGGMFEATRPGVTVLICMFASSYALTHLLRKYLMFSRTSTLSCAITCPEITRRSQRKVVMWPTASAGYIPRRWMQFWTGLNAVDWDTAVPNLLQTAQENGPKIGDQEERRDGRLKPSTAPVGMQNRWRIWTILERV